MKFMKKFRVIAATLVLMLACQCFAPASFAAAPVNKAELYNRTADYLLKIGAVTGTFEGVDFMSTLTRKDMASILSKLIQVNHVMPAPSADPAGDVKLKNAEQAKDTFIMTAYDVMPLDENGNFRPGAYATLGEVKYAFASLLGYVNYAKATGLGEAELSKLIAKTDLLEGISLADNDMLTKADFLVILKNALDEEMIYQTLFSGTAVEFDKNTEVTMMEEYLNIVVYEGMVTANKHTSIFEPTGLDSDQVLIEGYLVYTGSTNIADYIGTNVEVYVQEDPDTEKGTAVMVDYASDVNVLTITAEDLMADAASFSLTSIAYADEKGKLKTARVSPTANYFYNGRMCDLTKEDFDINNGAVTLVSNNGGSTYDVVKVDSYVNYIVEYVTESDDVVTLYAKNGMTLDLSETGDNGIKYIELRRSNGRVVKPSQLKTNNILSAYVSKDGGYVKGVVSTTVVDGEVRGIDESGVRSVFTIEDVDYPAYFFGTDWGTDYEGMYPQMGSEGTFYIDASGYIAYIEYKPVTTKYGLLTGIIKASTMSSEVTLQLVDENGVITEIPVSEKGVKINNYDGKASYTKPGDLYDLLRGNDQLIQYAVNDDGVLRKLNIAQDIASVGTATFGLYSESVFSLDKKFDSTQKYSTTTKKFGDASSVQGAPASTTKIFIIDNESVTDNDINANGVSVVTQGSLRHDMELSDIKYYDFDSTFVPAAMVAVEPVVDTENSNADQKLYVFDSTTRKLNDEGEEVLTVSVWDRGNLKTYTCAEGTKINAVKKGDPVAVYRNFDNEITAIKNIKSLLEADGATGTVIYSGGSANEFSSYGYVGKAYVLSASSEKMAYVYEVKNSYSSADIKTLNLQSPVVYEISEGDRDTEIKVSSLSIVPKTESPDENSKIYYFSNQGRVYDVVIYR